MASALSVAMLALLPAVSRAQVEPPPLPSERSRSSAPDRSGDRGALAPGPASAPARSSSSTLTPPPTTARTAHTLIPPPTPRELLNRAIDLYVVGRYREAAELLRPLVEGKALSNRADQQEALRAYGISLFLSKARSGAERAFRDLLRLDPTERLDPAFVRPEVVAFFGNVRRRQQAELAAEVDRRRPRRLYYNLIPPGGQFQNGHRRKAWTLLAGELATVVPALGTGIALWVWGSADKTFDGQQEVAQALQITNWVTFGLAVALFAYGIIDGLYYYYRLPTEGNRVGAEGHRSSLAPGGSLFSF